MATVYIAYDVRHERQVALKVLLPDLAAAVGPERFKREIRTAAGLSHPNIVPLYDSGDAAGTFYYAMPLVTGESLRDRLTRELQLPVDEALQIVREVAGALAYAHGQGIVHRDIKPENILMSAGHAVVADFGIAAVLGAAGDSKLTSTGMSVGTPAYMSPEQASGAPVDGRSDIYSLGCVLYELLAGTPPFTGPNVQAVVARHMTDPVPSIRTVRRTVPVTLERVVMKALAKVPADRFATARDFAQALPFHVDVTDATERAVPGVRRRLVWAAGLAVVLLLAGAGVAFRSGLRDALRGNRAAITSLAVMPFRNLTGDTAQAFLAVSSTEQVVNSLVRLSALRVIKVDDVSSVEVTDSLLQANGFDAVLTGSIVRSGNTVRISVQLRSVETGQSLPGGGSYNGVMEDILALQDEVARSVADSIRVTMTPQERSRLVAERRPVSVAAFEAYARGTVFVGRVTGPDIRRAIASFQRAIEEDSTYVDAWVGLSDAYGELGYYGLVQPVDAFPAARDAAIRALSLDSTSGAAHSVLARAQYSFFWDFSAADRSFQRALALNPGNAHTHFSYGAFLAAMGRREESIAEARRSTELDPVSLIISAAAARPYYNARDYAGAIAQSRRTLELDPDFSRALFWLGQSYEQTSRLPEAIRALERTVGQAPIPVYQATLAHAYAIAGERAKAEQILRTLLGAARSSYVSSFDIATIYAGLGDRARTMDWLERAYEGRATYLVFLGVDPRFDSFRTDPRFRELVRRIGLPAST